MPDPTRESETTAIVVGPDRWQEAVASAAEPLNGSLRLEAADSLLDALVLAEREHSACLLVSPTDQVPLTDEDLCAMVDLTHRPRLVVDEGARLSLSADGRVDAWLSSEPGGEALASVVGLDARGSQHEPNAENIPGDVDLIDALLAGVDALRVMLLDVFAGQTGVSGASLVSGDDVTHPPGVSVDVVHEGVTYGRLVVTSRLDVATLRRWAAWMARWLMLADRQNQMQELAFSDPLTGVRNRRYFDRFLQRALERAREERSQVTVLVFDIDNFKMYNDRYGHAAGDTILRESARLMQSMVREHDVVARIGGDEFAVVFWDASGPRQPNSRHPHDVLQAARRFQKALCSHEFPELLEGAASTLTISGGLASYPWDGRTATELMERADQMALSSKRQGKNAITFGPGAADKSCGEPDDA
ncbi:GGDEF domain-containing protein [Mucisphaera calidilacus]|uniref:diguanylate cyclase n=1 Tax=Mucisphaera calidilacus TaxID=2527982 RepID=A0A518BVE4_9BACT|nr:GGDEF domain-containing protein [Mucisphaera calidilacus]QDU70955.1 Response regulator PleD [Mucisphaera calidilacus]